MVAAYGSALLIGAEDQGEGLDGLAPALGLASLRFVALDEDEDVLSALEAEVANPETDLVMIAYRLPPETYARFKELCMESGRPFVWSPMKKSSITSM